MDPKETTACVYKETLSVMFTAELKTSEKLKCPSTGEWIIHCRIFIRWKAYRAVTVSQKLNVSAWVNPQI